LTWNRGRAASCHALRNRPKGAAGHPDHRRNRTAHRNHEVRKPPIMAVSTGGMPLDAGRIAAGADSSPHTAPDRGRRASEIPASPPASDFDDPIHGFS